MQMMRRTAAVLLSAVLFGCAVQEVPKKDASFHAVIVSDLHFTTDPEVISSVVPSMPYSYEVSEAIINEVIDVHPDVFLLLGDQTNSGALSDMEELCVLLDRVEDAGIEVIPVTGNHDFNRSDQNQYDEIYGHFYEGYEKDPASLSYTLETGGVRLMVMDDNAVNLGDTGTFSDETMRWLKRHLKEAKERGTRVLFLSHHNVLAGENDARSFTYRITNESLVPLLQKSGVRLCLSGHLHTQSILEKDGMYEVISGMPMMSGHYLGFLDLEGDQLCYHAESIDFDRYGEPGLRETIERCDALYEERMRDVFRELLGDQKVPADDTEGILNLIAKFLDAYTEGSLPDERDAIRNDPYYPKMKEALSSSNYGPWIESILESPPLSGTELAFRWD